jgi:malate permease and related proteins
MNFDEVMEVATAAVPVFVLIGLGLLARSSRCLTREADESLLKLTIRFLYPCFIFDKVLGEASLTKLNVLWWPVASGFASIVVGFGVGWAVAAFLKIADTRKRRAFAFTSGIFNYGYFAIPVCDAVFGASFVGKLLVFNLGVEVAIWGVGVLLLGGGAFGVRRLFNPPILALVAALWLNNMGWADAVPSFALVSIQMVGACAIPIGLLLIGATTLDLWREQRSTSWDWRVAGGGALVRLLLLPCVMLAVARWAPFPRNVDWLHEIFVLQAAMPAGIFAIVIARYYDADANVAAQTMAPTIVLCLLTLPMWLIVGRYFAGV